MTHTKPRFVNGLLLLLSLLLLSTAAGLPASRAQSNRQLDAPISVPFELVTRHIMIPVSVNGGAPLWFVLDTGDKVGIIDRQSSELTMTAILELFERPVSYKVTIRRDQATLSVVLKPRPMI